MSFQAMSEAVTVDLAGNCKFVFIMMANYADDKNHCWPSYKTLAELTGLSEQTVKRTVSKLVDLGYLKVIRQGSGRTSSKYEMFFKVEGIHSDHTQIDHAQSDHLRVDTQTPSEGGTVYTDPIKETVIEPVTKKTKQKESFDLSAWQSKPSPDIWRDYLHHRKNIKAPLTQTVVNRIAKCINQLLSEPGLDADEVLGLAMERGWRGLEVEWVRKALNLARQPAVTGAQNWNDVSWAEDLGL